MGEGKVQFTLVMEWVCGGLSREKTTSGGESLRMEMMTKLICDLNVSLII